MSAKRNSKLSPEEKSTIVAALRLEAKTRGYIDTVLAQRIELAQYISIKETDGET